MKSRQSHRLNTPQHPGCRHTLIPYQSLRAKGSCAFFLRPFLPFDNLLFLGGG